MPEEARFSLVYDGEGLQDGAMEVEDLAPALLALQDLVEEANAVATGGRVDVKLRVQAGFRRGSFGIDLQVVEGIVRPFVDFFSSPGATAVTNILALIGISGGVGLVQLIRRSRGRPARRAVEVTETRKVRIEFEGEPPIDVDPAVWRLFRNPKARSATSRIVRPVNRPEIDLAKFVYHGEESLIADPDSASAFDDASRGEGEVVSEGRRVLQLIAVSFRDGNKWRVTEGGRTIYVSVLDEDFLDRVRNRDVLFGDSDFLDVTLRIRQWTDTGQLRVSHEILKVHDHKQSADQLRLFDQDHE